MGTSSSRTHSSAHPAGGRATGGGRHCSQRSVLLLLIIIGFCLVVTLFCFYSCFCYFVDILLVNVLFFIYVYDFVIF